MTLPTPADIHRGHRAFREHESRDAMYRVAMYLVEQHWADPAWIADSLGVLLLTWNQAFYRYGAFDFGKLERCVRRNYASLTAFRSREILGYSDHDDPEIRRLFLDFIAAVAVARGGKTRRSPVAVAKALHLLAPSFFPLWDRKIAAAYACNYAKAPDAAYLRFVATTKVIAATLAERGSPELDGSTALKLIDEYNYSKAQGWI